jgi:outer membrane receptor protein involved in Fe transport
MNSARADGCRWGTRYGGASVSSARISRDDILFTVVETGGGGFFQNVGRTRRQGVEVGLLGAWQRLTYFASYAYVDATYQTDETLASVTDPDGVRVEAGDRIPGIPPHNFKVGAEVALLDNLWIGGDLIATSGSYLRGDDGNDRPKLDGYTILNLHVRYAPITHVELWGRVDNVTDADYETAGVLNFNAFARSRRRRALRGSRSSHRRLGRRQGALLTPEARAIELRRIPAEAGQLPWGVGIADVPP